MSRVDWLDQKAFPERVVIEETGQVFELDQAKDLITFGRMSDQSGQRAHNIVLRLSDEAKSKMISRYHFQLERKPAG